MAKTETPIRRRPMRTASDTAEDEQNNTSDTGTGAGDAPEDDQDETEDTGTGAGENADDASSDEAMPEGEPEDGDLVEVNIVRPFNLTIKHGEVRRIPKGRQMMERELADHWMVKHNSDKPPPRMLSPGTQEYALNEARRAARKRLLDAAVEQEAQAAVDQIRTTRKQ